MGDVVGGVVVRGLLFVVRKPLPELSAVGVPTGMLPAAELLHAGGLSTSRAGVECAAKQLLPISAY